jgi:hypothetical protein
MVTKRKQMEATSDTMIKEGKQKQRYNDRRRRQMEATFNDQRR